MKPPYQAQVPQCLPTPPRLSRGHGLGHKPLERKLLLLEVLGGRVLELEGTESLRHGLLNLLLLVTLDLERQGGVRDDLLDAGDIGLKLLLRLEPLAEGLIRGLELLGIVDHVLDLVARELANRVGDGDVGAAARGLLGGGDLEDTVDVDLEDNLEDGLTSLHRGDGGKGEFTERGVVLAVGALALEDGELHSLLVVGNSGEGALLESRHSATAGNDGSEDVALHGHTEGERNDVEEEEIGGVGGGGLAREDTGLNGGTIGDGLVGVDALLELLAIEELAEELLDAGDTGGATDENDLINAALLDTGILEDLGNGLESTGEGLGVEVLETSTSDLHVQVVAIKERVDLNGGLGTAGQSTLGALAGGSEATESTGIVAHVRFRFPGELLHDICHNVVVEVLATEMGVASSRANSEHTTI